jgi:hypothetical protein
LELLQEVQEAVEGVKVEDVNILFLDISSSCSGFSIFKTNFKNSTAELTKAGAIWLPDVSHQEKYAYMVGALLNYFNLVEHIDVIISEAYMINPKKLMGCLTSIELHGALKYAAEEMGVKFFTFPVQSWRAALGIRKNADKEFKTPAKEKVQTVMTIPEQVVSNITGKLRNTPNDLTDAICIGWGWMVKNNFKHVSFSKAELQTHVGYLDT